MGDASRATTVGVSSLSEYDLEPSIKGKQKVGRDEADWDAYAKHYDELCYLNPAYHENVGKLLSRLEKWDLPPTPAVCDLGAGTGNFLLELNRAMPNGRYWHVDFDDRMTGLAKRKYSDAGLSNVQVVKDEIHNVAFPDESFDLILCINALYAFTPQEQVLANVRKWLKPEGRLFLVDFGRKQSTLDWTIYIFREAMKSRQVGRYAKSLIEGREVLKQNRRVSKGQESGRYWLHSTQEFGESLVKAGFVVEELEKCYRGYADMAVCRK